MQEYVSLSVYSEFYVIVFCLGSEDRRPLVYNTAAASLKNETTKSSLKHYHRYAHFYVTIHKQVRQLLFRSQNSSSIK